MNIPDDMIKTLADIGFMASSSGHSKHAFAIFSGIETAKPDSILPDIGYAMEFMNKKKYQEAIALLKRQGLKKDPENTAVQAFIGLALMLNGHNKDAEKCLNELTDTNDSTVATMANELLENIHTS
ncbi:MAG: tetratricopeptide repeat protein [Endozoicomonas sp. (ex Botrylloides leachii)]|nr:tetratricopeptide repeat protein [Endozoicomonas sp. (ex Botrylloides leachii)]